MFHAHVRTQCFERTLQFPVSTITYTLCWECVIMNHGIVVHNRDPTKNCVNTLIERTPKTIFKASYGVEKTAQILFQYS